MMFRKRVIVALLICVAAQSSLVWPKDAAERGSAAFERGDFREAVTHYQEALRSKPSFGLYVNLGHCYTRLEQWQDAAEAYQAAIELDAKSVTGQVWRFLGQSRYRSGQFQQALDAFVEAVSLEPNNQDDVWIARCMIELQQWIQGQSVLLTHLQRSPRDTDALELLAYVVGQIGDYRSVIDVYKQLLTVAPRRTEYRVALANALTADGHNRQAIDVLEFAWRVDRIASERIHRLLADLYLAEDMPQEAAECYGRLIMMMDSPTCDDYYRLGVAYFQIGELTSAKNAFEGMQQADTSNFKADLYLGHVAAERGDFDKARLCYMAATEKNPSSAEGFVALANLQMKDRRYSDAATHFAKVIGLGDDRAQVHYNRILALMHQSHREQAKAAFKEALAEHPADQQLLRLLDRYLEEEVSN